MPSCFPLILGGVNILLLLNNNNSKIKNSYKALYDIWGFEKSSVQKISKKNKEKMSRMDHLYVPGKEVIHFTPDKGKAWESSSYNYKLLVSINEDSEVWAEIDSDSHLNLISEDYYFYLANNTKITYKLHFLVWVVNLNPNIHRLC
jgi:hypothetical protein